MFTIDMDEGRTTHIGHTGTGEDGMQITFIHSNLRAATRITGITTAIDAAANDNLRLHCHCSEEHHQTYYGRFNFQFSIINYQLSIFNLPLSSGCPGHRRTEPADRWGSP